MFNNNFFKTLGLFIFVNIFLYSFIILFHDLVPFHKVNYEINAHHYLKDPKAEGDEFNFLRSLGQYDAQWYLKIGEEGYPKNPKNTNQNDKNILDGLTYAFFPLYPLLVGFLNTVLGNIELSAFFISNIIMIANFFSLYFVISRLFSKKIAYKTIFLIFLSPFSIFFRSYFTEGLFLLLFLWFGYFLVKKELIYSSLFLGLLTITRPQGLFLVAVFIYFLIRDLKINRLYLNRALLYLSLIILPFFAWVYFNYINTGDPLYFWSVQTSWFKAKDIFQPILTNISSITSFSKLPLHLFHKSRIDLVMVFISALILFRSKKILPLELWLSSLMLTLVPLLVKDTMSCSRYISVIFPLFIFLSIDSENSYYPYLISVFSSLLLITSLFFINWWWIG